MLMTARTHLTGDWRGNGGMGDPLVCETVSGSVSPPKDLDCKREAFRAWIRVLESTEGEEREGDGDDDRCGRRGGWKGGEGGRERGMMVIASTALVADPEAFPHRSAPLWKRTSPWRPGVMVSHRLRVCG